MSAITKLAVVFISADLPEEYWGEGVPTELLLYVYIRNYENRLDYFNNYKAKIPWSAYLLMGFLYGFSVSVYIPKTRKILL